MKYFLFAIYICIVSLIMSFAHLFIDDSTTDVSDYSKTVQNIKAMSSVDSEFKVIQNKDKKEKYQPAELIVRDQGNGRSVVIFENSYWEAHRHFPSGYIDIYHKNEKDQSFKRVPTSLNWRRNTHPMKFIEGANNSLFLVSYDVVANLPSGRRLSGVRSGFDLYLFERGINNDPERIADSLPLGGIDSLLYGTYDQGDVHVCGGNRCFTISEDGKKTEWDLSLIDDYEFVELEFKDQEIAVLLRRLFDDRYHGKLNKQFSSFKLGVFNILGGTLTEVPKNGIPWNIDWSESNPTYRLATKPEQIENLLYFDISRMPFSGLMNIGANNLEGRVAWNQAYYLNGFASILSGKAHNLTTNSPSWLENRLFEEIRFIQDLSYLEYPGYFVKRYSIDREPLLFALHLGRIAVLLNRANEAGVPIEDSVIKYLSNQLISFEKTVEELINIEDGLSSYTYLGYQSNYPFWADGANVPYNYVSGVVEGAMTLGLDERAGELYFDLLLPLLENELQNQKNNIWRYWWGDADNGWSEAQRVSLNTPTYGGNNKGLAHITYRTMDVKAILSSNDKQGSQIFKKMIEQFKLLTEMGMLLPDVNEYFSENGGAIKLNKFAVKRYARSTAPWEIQGQVWAINQLVEDWSK